MTLASRKSSSWWCPVTSLTPTPDSCLRLLGDGAQGHGQPGQLLLHLPGRGHRWSKGGNSQLCLQGLSPHLMGQAALVVLQAACRLPELG